MCLTLVIVMSCDAVTSVFNGFVLSADMVLGMFEYCLLVVTDEGTSVAKN